MPRRPLLLISLAIITLIGLGADLGWREYTRPRFAVLVDGELVGALRKAEEADQALAAVMAEITPDMEPYVNLTDALQVRPLEQGENLSMTDTAEIKQALVKTIPSLTYAMAITVNGADIVAVADEAAAQEVKDRILEEYRATVLADAAAVEQLQFQEQIGWHPKLILTENLRTVDEAIRILKYGTDKLVTHVVKSGDTGWDIARSYNVSLEQLAEANPDVNLDLLQIDQTLNVTFREPYVHTISVSQRVVEQAIPFDEQTQKDASLWPWQYQVITPGVPGLRQLTIREYRENGKVIKTETISVEVKREPKTQIAKTGTKQIPDMGTGSLVFPVVGVLSSEYGPRWGSWHTGIDIAAPPGTPVLAADSGMVVFRGWSGNYGNLIKVDHGGGKMVTYYGHLSRFNVALGDQVTKGQVIGYVGNTGYSTGPHLHYEVRVDGESVDPLRYYK